LQNGEGKTVSLKRGAEVEVTVAADPDATTKQTDSPATPSPEKA
jgi:hypothetical protein